MKIIIVDDEPFFIEQLKKKLAILGADLGAELTVTAECYSGREALEAIGRETPDVVFTDIRMTAMNGIELVKEIRKEHPELPVVILSAYPSFEYLREAMRVNVSEYLLKPIDVQALKEILEKLVANVANKSYLRSRKALLTILASPQLPPAVEKAVRERLPYPFYRALFIANVESVHEFPILDPSNGEEADQLRLALDRTLFGDESAFAIPLDDGRSQLLVLGLTDDGEDRLNSVLDVISGHYSGDGIGPSVIYSDAFSDILRLNRLVPALRIALSERLVIGKALFLAASAPPSGMNLQVSNPYGDVEKAKLDRLLAERDYRGITELIRSLIRIWEKNDCPTVTVGLQLKDIVHRIESHERKSKESGHRHWDARIEEQLHTSRSFAELAEGFLSMLASTFEWGEAWNDSHDMGTLFSRIETYIASHIGQPLSLPLLTEQFHISKTLLCNLFRDFSGKSFVEYVTAHRMHKAQELMIHYPRMRNKEIAEMVGYVDQNYFSRVFTSVIGMSPSEFRSRNGSGNP